MRSLTSFARTCSRLTLITFETFPSVAPRRCSKHRAAEQRRGATEGKVSKWLCLLDEWLCLLDEYVLAVPVVVSLNSSQFTVLTLICTPAE